MCGVGVSGRRRLCAVPDGIQKVVQAVWCRDTVARHAAAEVVANVASSFKLRGKLVEAQVLPALSNLLLARAPELKRLAMEALQMISMIATLPGTVNSLSNCLTPVQCELP